MNCECVVANDATAVVPKANPTANTLPRSAAKRHQVIATENPAVIIKGIEPAVQLPRKVMLATANAAADRRKPTIGSSGNKKFLSAGGSHPSAASRTSSSTTVAAISGPVASVPVVLWSPSSPKVTFGEAAVSSAETSSSVMLSSSSSSTIEPP